MVAVKHGVALIAAADGPYAEFGPDNTDHPAAVDVDIARTLGDFVNSFRWQGDPSRRSSRG